jgi:hypothetical protein
MAFSPRETGVVAIWRERNDTASVGTKVNGTLMAIAAIPVHATGRTGIVVNWYCNSRYVRRGSRSAGRYDDKALSATMSR